MHTRLDGTGTAHDYYDAPPAGRLPSAAHDASAGGGRPARAGRVLHPALSTEQVVRTAAPAAAEMVLRIPPTRAPSVPPSGANRRRRAGESLSRILAMLLLPLSIAPVLLLGPSVLRAPVALAHEAWGEIQRFERQLRPAHRSHPRAIELGPSAWRPTVSMGPVYGRWIVFPQTGGTGFAHVGGRAPASGSSPR